MTNWSDNLPRSYTHTHACTQCTAYRPVYTPRNAVNTHGHDRHRHPRSTVLVARDRIGTAGRVRKRCGAEAMRQRIILLYCATWAAINMTRHCYTRSNRLTAVLRHFQLSMLSVLFCSGPRLEGWPHHTIPYEMLF